MRIDEDYIMLLIINVCKHEMHYAEFVQPIVDIVKKYEVPFDVLSYNKITSRNYKKILSKYHRIIICGTSLQDMHYSKELSKFKWLTGEIAQTKPILGICGGMQILCLVNGCKLQENLEIGLVKIDFTSEFLKVNGSREVYALHNMSIKNDAMLKKNFKIFSFSKIVGTKNSIECVQAVVSKRAKHYGVLFHPEARNKDLIVNFLSI